MRLINLFMSNKELRSEITKLRDDIRCIRYDLYDKITLSYRTPSGCAATVSLKKVVQAILDMHNVCIDVIPAEEAKVELKPCLLAKKEGCII